MSCLRPDAIRVPLTASSFDSNGVQVQPGFYGFMVKNTGINQAFYRDTVGMCVCIYI